MEFPVQYAEWVPDWAASETSPAPPPQKEIRPLGGAPPRFVTELNHERPVASERVMAYSPSN
jgi:hypothetical protein